MSDSTPADPPASPSPQATTSSEPRATSVSLEAPESSALRMPLDLLLAPGHGWFRALRHPEFRLFWTGNFISNIGSWMQNVAQGWLVLQLTNSPLWLGLVGFAQQVPALVFSLLGGVIADRASRRRLLMVLARVRFPARAEREANSIGAEMAEGFRYVRENPTILLLVLLVGMISMFGMPYLVMMPAFAKDVLLVGARGLGYLVAASGVGAIIGGINLAMLKSHHRRGPVL